MSYTVETADSVVQGISYRYCTVIQRVDGYGYSQHGAASKASTAAPSPLYLPALKGEVSRVSRKEAATASAVADQSAEELRSGREPPRVVAVTPGDMNDTLLVRTAKLKLRLSPTEKALLGASCLAYRDALNHVSAVAFENGKTSSKAKLQKLTYYGVRKRFGLPAQLTINVCRQVGATYQTQWSKIRNNAKALKAGWTRKRHKGLDRAPKYVSRTMTYNHGRDYTFRPDGRASIQTLEGRIVVEVRGWHRHLDELKQARLGEAKIWFCPRRKEYYLLVAYSVTVAASDPAALESVVGVDLGQRYPAVASDTGNRTLFVASGAGRQLLDRYARTRRSLQSKGTRSSVRRLRARRTREERFRADVNHQVANRIVERYPQAVIGMEELTRIRERTEPRSRKTASPKRRKSNRRRSGWSFADLQAKIAYKAQRDGSVAVKVDADYTSQQCPSCGHTSRANRPRKGLLFVCGQCGFRLHADLVGGRNIAMRTMLVRHDWMSTGRLSTGPDVTRSEAKAERLLRYSELRWSAVTSPDYIPVRELVAGR